MKIAEFIRMTATEMDMYLRGALPTDFTLLDPGRSLYSYLGLTDFNKALYHKGRVIKKRHAAAEGLGGILISSDFDLTFFDTSGRAIGNLWRYRDGNAVFSSSIIRQTTKNSIGRVSSVLEMLKIARGDEIN